MVSILGCALAPGQSGHDAGRMLLAELYRRRVGGGLPEILVEAMGKPYFAVGNLHFSITHTKHRAFCALAEVPVGLDAEEQSRRIRPETARRALAPAERAAWEQAEDPDDFFLRLWVVKEARAKITGQGLGDPRKLPVDPATFQPEPGYCAGLFAALDCHVALCCQGDVVPKVSLEIME